MLFGSAASRRTTALAFLLTVANPSLARGDSRLDDPEARPPVSALDVAVVKRAAALLGRRGAWNRKDDRNCPVRAKTFSVYCALEKAIVEIKGGFAHRDAIMQEARFTVEAVEPASAAYAHRLMDYNNDPRRRFSDVRVFFGVLETRLAARLCEQASGSAGVAGPDAPGGRVCPVQDAGAAPS